MPSMPQMLLPVYIYVVIFLAFKMSSNFTTYEFLILDCWICPFYIFYIVVRSLPISGQRLNQGLLGVRQMPNPIISLYLKIG